MRYRLRTLFIVVATVAVLSAWLRSALDGDLTSLLGIGAFCYGGIVAIPCYAFVGSLVVLSTTTTAGQRAGTIFAAIMAGVAWMTFVVSILGRWPQLCIAYAIVTAAILYWLVRSDWIIAEGPSPEAMLDRLKQAKQDSLRRM